MAQNQIRGFHWPVAWGCGSLFVAHEADFPTRDTGTDLLVTNETCNGTVSLQVKFSKDFLVTHMTSAFQPGMKACGWFSLNAKKLSDSSPDLWIFALHRLNHRELDTVIIPPTRMLSTLTSIHGSSQQTFQSYI